ncbi:MAG: 16S rRNA (cytidine(1402)-2'-O)-methyltransferase [Defluviitaleaceae bacterium]|nr:16S rRNA (cytidine(1402)-2'-O)-methyltransferase [Defluviitaleaceae bacterium]
MQVQKSFQHDKATLFLVSTPIGNLSDMTPRAVETLKTVALIASEDTRVTKKLCNHFDIDTPLTSYHEHNKHQKTELIVQRLSEGDPVALVSDAGMPLISDPGDQLVKTALDQGYAVVPIPGANAVLTALIASGLPAQPFLFYGFLERQKSKKKAQLTTVEPLPVTLIFYESPHRLKETLVMMLEVFGNRQVVVARELTKLFEEFLRGRMTEILMHLTDVKGEVVLLVEGNHEEAVVDRWWEGLTLHDHVAHYVAQGQRTNEAIKQVANDLGRTRQAVYKEYHHA